MKYFLIFFQKTNEIFQIINLKSQKKKKEVDQTYSKNEKNKKYRFKNTSFPRYKRNFFLKNLLLAIKFIFINNKNNINNYWKVNSNKYWKMMTIINEQSFSF